MKFSKSWLEEWVKPNISTDTLIEQLTMAGLEVDSVNPVAVQFSNVVVAHVLDVKPHPNADKLHLCTVDVGQDSPLSIVCGAPNVRVDLKVPCALVGAVLSEMTIEKVTLRGNESNGMLCSAKELGLADSSEGIYELPSDASVGLDLHDYLDLNDVSIDVELTPNRGDCASIHGIAREVATLNRMHYQMPEIELTKVVTKEIFPVKLSANQSCPHYVGRVLSNVNVHALTPLWMKEKLRRSGLRSIDPVVDVTNYVLLELGQPMHAFDFDQLADGIDVRFAKKGEQLVLLDSTVLDLTIETLVIADHKKVLAMAGVMGGAEFLVKGGSVLAKKVGIPTLLIGLTIIALGTSLPEVVTAIVAGLKGVPNIAVGSTIGSNIANLTAVIGIVTIIIPLTVHPKMFVQDMPVLFVIMSVIGIFIYDGQVTRIEGIGLLITFVLYIGLLIRQSIKKTSEQKMLEVEYEHEIDFSISMTMTMTKTLTYLFAGLIILPVSADLLVQSAINIATFYHISDLVIGLTVVAFGTSLPELATCIAAARRNEHDIVIGNIIGSNIINLLVVLSSAAVITPIKIHSPEVMSRDFPWMIGTGVVFYLLAFGLRNKMKLTRYKGFIMVSLYIIYLLVLLKTHV